MSKKKRFKLLKVDIPNAIEDRGYVKLEDIFSYSTRKVTMEGASNTGEVRLFTVRKTFDGEYDSSLYLVENKNGKWILNRTWNENSTLRDLYHKALKSAYKK